MTRQREGQFVDKGRDILKARGACVIKIHGTALARHGEPDLVGSYGRFAFAIECKLPGEDLRRDQYIRLKEWKKAGASVGVATLDTDFVDIAIRGISNLEDYRKAGW